MMTPEGYSLYTVAALDAVVRVIAGRSSSLRLLTTYVRSLNPAEISNSPELSLAVSTHLHDLIALTIGSHPAAMALAKGRGGHAARPQAIKADVLEQRVSRKVIAAVAERQEWSGPDSYNHYAVGWAHAMNTPYQWTKQVASHWGGTRNGTIVHWPNGIKAKGEIRSQFHHLIDVAPTILEAAGLPEPVSVNGIHQRPIEGVSMLYSFNDAKAAEPHETQHFEILGNRGIYHKGWTAVTKHATPWVLVGRKTVPLDDDVWELYDTSKDWSQANDLSKQMPEKLHELQRLWLIEATRYNVLPIDDRTAEKFNPDTAGRPVLIKGKTQLLFGGMGRLSENCVLSIKNKSHSVTAEIDVPESEQHVVVPAT